MVVFSLILFFTLREIRYNANLVSFFKKDLNVNFGKLKKRRNKKEEKKGGRGVCVCVWGGGGREGECG